jgi:hypothetical protein
VDNNELSLAFAARKLKLYFSLQCSSMAVALGKVPSQKKHLMATISSSSSSADAQSPSASESELEDAEESSAVREADIVIAGR